MTNFVKSNGQLWGAARDRVLFPSPPRFKSKFGTLPRLLKKPYNDIADADVLLAEFPKMKTDHDVRYRSVGICGTTSLLGKDPEAPPKNVFLCKDQATLCRFHDKRNTRCQGFPR